MDRALQDRLLLDPHVALGSDDSPGGSHPRSAGTFAKWIEEFVLRQPRVSIEEAVRRATSYPASILGLAARGTIREGAKADLLLFDPAKVHRPEARSVGKEGGCPCTSRWLAYY